MDLKSLLKDKFVLVLLFVIVLNFVVFVLVWRLDVFVNGDLYDFGLIMNVEWANDYWHNARLLWAFLAGSTALTAASIIPHYNHSQEPSKYSKMFGFLLPTIAIIYQVLCVMYLMQIGSIVQNRLIDFGVPANYNWDTFYNPVSTTALVFMAVAMLALIIPAMRTLEIIEIEIVQEELDVEIESTSSNDQKVETQINLTAIKGVGPKRALELERAGVKTVSDLTKWSPKNLAEKTGIPIKQISKWINEANIQSNKHA